MNNWEISVAALALWASALVPLSAHAHGGEDHGASATVATQGLLPRAGTATDEFELLAVLEAGRLLIYLDTMATNAPMPQATVEVDGAGATAVATEVAPGAYALVLATPLAPGAHALTFTVQTADSADLLAATLEVPAPSVAVVHPVVAQGRALWLGGGALLVVVGAVALAWSRRQKATIG